MIIWIVKYVESLTWFNLNKPFCDSYKIHIRLLQISPLDFYAIAHEVLIFKFELSILRILCLWHTNIFAKIFPINPNEINQIICPRFYHTINLYNILK